MMNMHNNNKTVKIVCAIVAVLLVIAMVVPVALSALV